MNARRRRRVMDEVGGRGALGNGRAHQLRRQHHGLAVGVDHVGGIEEAAEFAVGRGERNRMAVRGEDEERARARLARPEAIVDHLRDHAGARQARGLEAADRHFRGKAWRLISRRSARAARRRACARECGRREGCWRSWRTRRRARRALSSARHRRSRRAGRSPAPSR